MPTPIPNPAPHPAPALTPLAPLTAAQRSLLASFRASGYSLDADPDPIALAEALADPSLLRWIDHLRHLEAIAREHAEAADRAAARAHLRQLLADSPDPVEKRRAATALLRPSSPRPIQLARTPRPAPRAAADKPIRQPSWWRPPTWTKEATENAWLTRAEEPANDLPTAPRSEPSEFPAPRGSIFPCKPTPGGYARDHAAQALPEAPSASGHGDGPPRRDTDHPPPEP